VPVIVYGVADCDTVKRASLTLNFTTPALPPVVGSYLFSLNSTPNMSDPDAAPISSTFRVPSAAPTS